MIALTSRLFAMPPIIVPNRNIETYLKYEIARGAGIAAGLKFQMTEQFLDRLASSNKGRTAAEAGEWQCLAGVLYRCFVRQSLTRCRPCRTPCEPILPQGVMTKTPAT